MENKTQLHDAFGLTKDDAQKMKDFAPTYNLSQLGEGDVVAFKVLDEVPRNVKFKDKTGQEKEDKVLEVLHRPTGLKQTIWLSSKSVRGSFMQLAQKNNGTLKNLEVLISVRLYTHETYGKGTRAYDVQENHEPEKDMEE